MAAFPLSADSLAFTAVLLALSADSDALSADFIALSADSDALSADLAAFSAAREAVLAAKLAVVTVCSSWLIWPKFFSLHYPQNKYTSTVYIN